MCLTQYYDVASERWTSEVRTIIASQRLGKHISVATNTQATVEQLPLLCSDIVNTPSQQERGRVFYVVRAKWLEKRVPFRRTAYSSETPEQRN
jgi:hypothetical protein